MSRDIYMQRENEETPTPMGVWFFHIVSNIERVYIICKGCGKQGRLDDHTIEHNGDVTPSVVCPYCDYHEYIYLNEWQPR